MNEDTMRTGGGGERVSRFVSALLFAAICAAAAWLRFNFLDKSMWVDESTSYTIATQKSLNALLALTASKYTAHPPLYYILVHYWFEVFGASLKAMRQLSCVFGVLWVAVMYPVAMLLFKKRSAALAAMALAALSPFAVYISQIGRMYSLLTLLTLTASWFFLKLTLGDGRRLWMWAGWVVSCVGLLYTQYYGANVVVFHTLCVLMWRKRLGRNFVVGWFAALAVVAAGFSPWIGTFATQSKTVSYIMNTVFAGSIVKLQYLLVVAGIGAVFSGVPLANLTMEQFTALFVFSSLTLLVCFARFFLNRKKIPGSFGFLAMYLAAPIAIMFIGAAFVRGIAFQWHFSYLSPAAFLIAAYILTLPGARILRCVVVFFICALFAFGNVAHSTVGFWDHDWRAVARHITTNTRGKATVLSIMPMDDYPLKDYYLDGKRFKVNSLFSISSSKAFGSSPALAISDLSYVADCFWFVAPAVDVKKDADPDWLRAHFTSAFARDFPTVFTQQPVHVERLCLKDDDKPLRRMKQQHYDEYFTTSWGSATRLQERFKRADFFYSRKYAELAELEIRNGIKENGPLPDLLVNLGYILRARGRVEEALACWIEAEKSRPDNARIKFLLGETLYSTGRGAEALKYLKKVKGDEGMTQDSAGMIRSLEKAGIK